MRRTLLATLIGAGLTVPAAATEPGARPDGRAAFDRLKRLAGEWEGTVMTPDGPPVRVRWEPTAGGHVMRETMFPGTGHEMVTMYHLDRGELVLTHYCVAGNQPRMKLATFTPEEVAFDFTGGGNLDPARDTHMHTGRLLFKGDDRLETDWKEYAMGQPGVSRKFFLTRRKPDGGASAVR
jgi:hypothetical protein